MKRVLSLFFILIFAFTLMCSCSLIPEQIRFCDVFFYVDGELYEKKTVVMGQPISEPTAPSKENEIFVAWGTGGAVSYKYDFSTKVVCDMNLYAHFTVDAVSFTNMVVKKTMKSIVTIFNKSYNTGMGGLVEVESNTAQGSGVVIDISGGYCYVLTNSHVVLKEEGYAKQSFTVEDPWGNTYEAQVYKNPSKTEQAVSEEYDLAVICFKYAPEDDKTLLEITMGEDPDEKSYVASLGTPAGLQNALTVGNVVDYQPIKATAGSSMAKIDFDIILHNAFIDHGSSGGALINTKGELVGVNFAGYSDGIYGCAIPISKVIEFMSLYVY